MVQGDPTTSGRDAGSLQALATLLTEMQASAWEPNPHHLQLHYSCMREGLTLAAGTGNATSRDAGFSIGAKPSSLTTSL